MVSSYPHLVGAAFYPHAGRAWVRRFPSGEVEALYKSHSPQESELEVLNAWFEDVGIEDRVCARRSLPWPGQAPVKPGAELPRESNAERSARRARQAVRWKIKSLGADHLVTLTYRDNVTDYPQSKADFSRFVAMCRREWSAFRFVACPEVQARGAWHWHMAVRGFYSYDRLRGLWWRALGSRVSWSAEGKPVLLDGGATPGNVQGVYARRGAARAREWDISRLAGYLGKYVGKSIGAGLLDGGASYSCSRGLDHEVEKFVVRGLTFQDVSAAWFEVLDRAGLARPFLWQSSDRRVLWASGAGSCISADPAMPRLSEAHP